MSGGDRESTDVIEHSALPRSHEVGKRQVGPPRRLDHLLSQGVDHGRGPLPVLIAVELDVVSHAVGREEPEDTAGAEQPLPNDSLQQLAGIPE